MLVDHFPLLGLRLGTPRLELRLPAPEELAALAELAAEGIHDPEVMPFAAAWTDQPPADVARGVVQHHWAQLGAWAPDMWELNLAVFRDGVVVGQQSIGARDFAITREVHTGSWLGKRFHGQGIGTEMRAAVLHLAFEGLGAAEASSSAFVDNRASLAVSRKLGYEEVGTSRQVIRGALAFEHRLRITEDAWRSRRATEVTVRGLAACLPLLGAAS
ncbi:GNAT family N-acetyltransferase [Allokutzneria sp. NRRL B-24872]|uniref:GNAT family N-acetyltransferase n=1 Tax=Allokutzneria sp. NRRL B-24872 TaxID=1137961 RepID=UPI000A3B7344|nr:GNAT family N-acetyltransferase [Allokutzneria sp. NRRL B-24872]